MKMPNSKLWIQIYIRQYCFEFLNQNALKNTNDFGPQHEYDIWQHSRRNGSIDIRV